jgi:pyruvate formate lyase activating enzyme
MEYEAFIRVAPFLFWLEARGQARFVARELGVGTPSHISRFYPAYDLRHLPHTPMEALHRARDIGLQAGLRHVYIGNLSESAGGNIYCYECGALLIHHY